MRIAINLVNRSDSYGALASALCFLHCLATPSVIIFCNYSLSATINYLVFWKSLDLIFLLISLLMVYLSVQNTSKDYMKYFFWCSWFVLFFLIVNEKLELFHLPEYMIYVPTTFLSIVHIYNLKYCQCSNENCECPNNTKD